MYEHFLLFGWKTVRTYSLLDSYQSFGLLLLATCSFKTLKNRNLGYDTEIEPDRMQLVC